jgi:hypothetical protein
MATKKKGSGNVKGTLSTALVAVVLLGGVVGWAKVNDISDAGDAFGYFKAHSDRIAACGFERFTTLDCIDISTDPGTGERYFDTDRQKRVDSGAESAPGSTSGSDTGSGNKDTPGSTKDDDQGTTPSKPSPVDTAKAVPEGVVSGDKALAALNTLTVVDKLPEVDYVRSEWRHWTGGNCNTREQLLIDTGTNVKTDDKCRATSGSWFDPYTGDTVTDAGTLDIDHVIALGYASAAGGNAWSAQKKEQFANDPVNLIAVDAGENRSKSDQGPNDWMPRDEFKCDFSRTWVATASKYDLSVTEKDKKELEKGLSKC